MTEKKGGLRNIEGRFDYGLKIHKMLLQEVKIHNNYLCYYIFYLDILHLCLGSWNVKHPLSGQHEFHVFLTTDWGHQHSASYSKPCIDFWSSASQQHHVFSGTIVSCCLAFATTSPFSLKIHYCGFRLQSGTYFSQKK